MTLAVPKSTTVEKSMSLLTPNTLFVPAGNNTSFEAFQIDVCIHFHLNTYLVFKALISSVLETMLHFLFYTSEASCVSSELTARFQVFGSSSINTDKISVAEVFFPYFCQPSANYLSLDLSL